MRPETANRPAPRAIGNAGVNPAIAARLRMEQKQKEKLERGQAEPEAQREQQPVRGRDESGLPPGIRQNRDEVIERYKDAVARVNARSAQG